MKILSKKSFEEIRLWVYRNARHIDLAIWQYEFENGNSDAILSALSLYQNDDGGFGNAIEPDCWNPNSSPYATLDAISKLNNIAFADTSHPIIHGIFKFLESGAHCVENGWLFNIPSNDNYPHAPWWTYDPKANEYEHTGVTAGLVCFVLQFAEKESSLYRKAFTFAEKMLTKFKEPSNKGDMGLTGYCMLLEKIEQLELTKQLDISYLSANIKKHTDEAIVRDISKWVNYSVRPSQFVLSPDSLFYTGNEDIVNQELDYLIDTRPKNGVWGITWQWGKYPNEFAISENWWKAARATGTLLHLKKFGRLEN